jgi:hypothetical protein
MSGAGAIGVRAGRAPAPSDQGAGAWAACSGPPIVRVPVQPLTGEGGAGAIARQPLETDTIRGLDPHRGVQREPIAVAPATQIHDDLCDPRTCGTFP